MKRSRVDSYGVHWMIVGRPCRRAAGRRRPRARSRRASARAGRGAAGRPRWAPAARAHAGCGPRARPACRGSGMPRDGRRRGAPASGRLRRRSVARSGSACGSGTGRRVDGARHVAGEHDPVALAAGHRLRVAESSAPCTGAAAARKLVRRRDLDDPSEVHHGDAVGDVADDGEIVGDEDVRAGRTPASGRRAGCSTCDWIETSRAETGSSATTSFGCRTSARASPMRCRWPPLNWCG